MAQQLTTMRTPAAYAGVTAYAHRHTGDAAAAAYLALGHAYLIDKRYSDAAANLRLVKQNSEVLADYADFLAAEAEHNQGNEAAAEALLQGFNERYPDSIFDVEAPELEANVLLAQGNADGGAAGAGEHRRRSQRPAELRADSAQDCVCARPDSRTQSGSFKHLLLAHPLSPEAEMARAKLTAMGAESNLTRGGVAQPGRCVLQRGPLRRRGRAVSRSGAQRDAAGKRRNGFAVAAAACDLKLKRLTEAQAQASARYARRQRRAPPLPVDGTGPQPQ